MPVSNWSTTASSNDTADSVSGIAWPEGMSPAQANDSARAMMAEIRKFYDNTVLKTGNHTMTGTLGVANSIAATSASGTSAKAVIGQTGVLGWEFVNEATTGNLIVGATGSPGAWKITRSGLEPQTQDWYIGGSVRLELASGYLIPGADNQISLGLSGFRWSVVYSATGAINTSDATLKTEAPLTDAVLRAAYRVPLRAFRLNDAIAEKGEANARVHYGYFAQDVAAELRAEGIDPATQAFWCEDELEDGTKRQGLRYAEFATLRQEAERRVLAGTLAV